MISEDRLRQAVRDAGALLDQSLPDPDQCHHTFSPAFLNRMEAPSIIDSTTMSRRQHTVIGFLKFRLDTGKQTVMKLKPQEMNSMKTRPENI